MLREVIYDINKSLVEKLFYLRQFTNFKVFNLAEQALRSTDNATLPYIPTGNGEWVGVDDRSPVIIYHRLVSSVMNKRGQGFGEHKDKDFVSFTIQTIVFNNEALTKMAQDELYLYICAAMPEKIRIEKFDYISVRINSVILSSQQVWRSEFIGTPYNLNPQQSLMAINFTIESEFKKNCFNSCPEV